VLENGTLMDGHQAKLSIFQGPIFGKSDRFAGEVQIPSRFFKVVVWRGHDAQLKSVGFIVDQSALLTEKRVALGPPSDKAKIDVQQYRVQLAEIERETSLDFGEDIRNADTFELRQAPAAGEVFSAISIRSEADILPTSARRPAQQGPR
jgi:endonuclease G